MHDAYQLLGGSSNSSQVNMQHAHQLLRAEKRAAFDFAAVDRVGDAAENAPSLRKDGESIENDLGSSWVS